MNKDVETIIAWRHNLRHKIGHEIVAYLEQLNLYATYLEILSEIDYGLMMDKEYTFVWDDTFYVDVQHYPEEDLEILCKIGLLKSSEEVLGYHQLIMNR